MSGVPGRLLGVSLPVGVPGFVAGRVSAVGGHTLHQRGHRRQAGVVDRAGGVQRTPTDRETRPVGEPWPVGCGGTGPGMSPDTSQHHLVVAGDDDDPFRIELPGGPHDLTLSCVHL